MARSAGGAGLPAPLRMRVLPGTCGAVAPVSGRGRRGAGGGGGDPAAGLTAASGLCYQTICLGLRAPGARRRGAGALERAQERVDDGRVELRARASLELAPRGLRANRLAVHAVA